MVTLESRQADRLVVFLFQKHQHSCMTKNCCVQCEYRTCVFAFLPTELWPETYGFWCLVCDSETNFVPVTRSEKQGKLVHIVNSPVAWRYNASNTSVLLFSQAAWLGWIFNLGTCHLNGKWLALDDRLMGLDMTMKLDVARFFDEVILSL